MNPPASRTVSAPRAAPAAPPPTRLDFFLIFLGVALSLYLVELAGYQTAKLEHAPAEVPAEVLKVLPTLPFLPLGVQLFWPVFYTGQRLRGRPATLSPAEWLWGVAWLASLALVVWVVWQTFPDAPKEVREDARQPVLVGYAVALLALAAVALLLNVLDLFQRDRRPWTHGCGLALLIWPALPFLALLAWK